MIIFPSRSCTTSIVTICAATSKRTCLSRYNLTLELHLLVTYLLYEHLSHSFYSQFSLGFSALMARFMAGNGGDNNFLFQVPLSIIQKRPSEMICCSSGKKRNGHQSYNPSPYGGLPRYSFSRREKKVGEKDHHIIQKHNH